MTSAIESTSAAHSAPMPQHMAIPPKNADDQVDKPALIDEEGRPTPAGWRKIGELLRKPMQAKQRKGPGGRQLSYLTARDVQNRLDGVVGPGNWSTSFRVLSREPWVVECTLTICGVSRADVGYSNAPDSEDEAEPAKAAWSDALKRAAVQWGIGRWLYEEAK